eukprot:TRINITY_DN19490_c0_g1_i1.p1 TRINITY_DN19490_c0_g1~~TRINITY_DN19490_c0_g1_i1.p1  ORF type:complete len:106 (+),score=3.52 TRINITY_DN19490_c0_g1_i1:361-678(+)
MHAVSMPQYASGGQYSGLRLLCATNERKRAQLGERVLFAPRVCLVCCSVHMLAWGEVHTVVRVQVACHGMKFLFQQLAYPIPTPAAHPVNAPHPCTMDVHCWNGI